jgi:hypothetical protein
MRNIDNIYILYILSWQIFSPIFRIMIVLYATKYRTNSYNQAFANSF